MKLVFNPILGVLLGFSVVLASAEIMLHLQEEFWFQNAVVLVMVMVPFFYFAATGMIKREKLKPSKLWDDNMRPIFQCTFFILVINIITNLAIRLQRLAVTPLEKYLYYGNLAIGEECFFRVLLGITIMIGLAWLIKKGGTRSPWPAYIITSIITAASWSITHWYVYKQTPLMFVGLFAMGIVLQLYLFTTRNPLVPIVAHFINNLIASVFVFIGVSAIWVFL